MRTHFAARTVALAALTILISAPTFAQRNSEALAASYPNKSIRLIVPSAPGGGTDIIARMIGQGLTEAWGQTIVIDNRGGAGGQAGVTIVAKQSASDGYTMLLGSVGHLSFASAIRKNLGIDPLRDLTPITLTAIQPFVIASTNTLPVKSIADLLALAKAKPKTITYGSGGSGSASHLGMELLQLKGEATLLHIAYKGSNPAITATMSGEIQLALAGLATVLPHARSGKLRALAVTGAKRARVAADVPTVSESGLPGYAFDVWYGLAFPGGTPSAIVNKTHAEVVKLLQSPEVSKRFTSIGVEPQTNTPSAFRKMIQDEIAIWRKVVADANIQVD